MGQLIEYLVQAHADVDHKTILGETPLSQACIYGLDESAATLIRLGAGVHIPNLLGVTTLMQASLMSAPTLPRMLLEARSDPNQSATTPYMFNLAGRLAKHCKPNAMIPELLQAGGARTPLLVACSMGNTGAVK